MAGIGWRRKVLLSGDIQRERAYRKLANAIVWLGYPEEFAQVLASELRSANAMERMAAYVRNARPTSPEQIADEMLTIVADRNRWVEQKMSEHANATMTAFYNRPCDDEE
ncbi:MAG: hypothetical protein Q4A07_03445 [Coriobacteriales bacterium]|nr:hypothetical protein [Coriobacteriales bacterium]